MPTHQRNRVPKRLFTILADTANDEDMLRQELRAFALEELEAKMRAVLEHIEAKTSDYWRTQQSRLIERMSKPKSAWNDYKFNPPRFTSGAIVEAFDISSTHAATILKELHDMRLLERALIVDDVGREFEYWL